jgi:uncharacterized protein (TIGR02145 family)
MKFSSSTAMSFLLLAGMSPAAQINLSGRVVDRAGNPVSGVDVELITLGRSALTSGDGNWSIFEDFLPEALGGKQSRAVPPKACRWTGRNLEIALDAPSDVEIGFFDLRGTSLGRLGKLRLEAGNYSIPLKFGSSGVTLLRVVVDGHAETVIASTGVVQSQMEDGTGHSSRSGAHPAARKTTSKVDTLRFFWRYKSQVQVPLADLDSSGIVAVIDTSVQQRAITYGSLEDVRDGQKYRTVRIGSQNWMAENLNFKPTGTDSGWRARPDVALEYGRLYAWSSAMLLPTICDSEWCEGRHSGMFLGDPPANQAVLPMRQGICPQGWRVPNALDWNALLSQVGYVDGDLTAMRGGILALMSQSRWNYQGGGTDSFGFRALPAAYRSLDSVMPSGTSAHFWLSSESETQMWDAAVGELEGAPKFVWGGAENRRKSEGRSLRCIEGTAVLDTSTALASLSVDVGKISPPFEPDRLSYTDTLAAHDAKLTVVARTVSAGAYTGSSSFSNYFGADSNVVDLVADSAIGISVFNSGKSRTYTIRIFRKAVDSSNFGVLDDTRAGGQAYRTVRIGTQNWMAENLNYAVDSSWWYMNSADSGRKYGRLYTWAGLMNLPDTCGKASCANLIQPMHRGVCPSGWHVPNNAEWSTLAQAVSGSMDALTALKSRTGWAGDGAEIGNGMDSYGFQLLPAGLRVTGTGTDFMSAGYQSCLWSATEKDPLQYWMPSPNFVMQGGTGSFSYESWNAGYSARCVEDQ